MASAALLWLFAALALLPVSLASSCPAFASERMACTATTCGHYIYRGKFVAAAAKPFVVKAAPSGLKLGASSQPADCCRQCQAHPDCAYWNYFPLSGRCYLYTPHLCNGTATDVFVPGQKNAFVGGRCNAQTHDTTSPAAATAAATSTATAANAGASASASSASTSTSISSVLSPPTEPLPSRTFCLISDPSIHINMMLGGYLDARTTAGGAPAARPQGTQGGGGVKGEEGGRREGGNGAPKAARVWIRELAVMWGKAGPGQKQHVLRVAARTGPEAERGEGFMGRIEVDGTEMPRISLGDELNLFEGQATLVFDSQAKEGPHDVDVYSLRVEGLLEAEIRLRPVHALLRQPGDALVHMTLDVIEIAPSSSVHGVLGQFYREDRPEQTLDYRTLSALMAVPFLSKERSRALGALDGEVSDYATSDLTSPDCRYSQFTLAPVQKVTPDQIQLDHESLSEKEKAANPISRFLTKLVAGQ